MRIDRMLSIVVILLNRQSITAKELAERFEVSLRTVYRDIDAINEAGIPIVSTQGSGGGFSIMENYKLNHQVLTLEDTRTILMALKGLNTTIRGQGMERAMEKISSLVPKDKKEELERNMDQLVIDYVPWGYNEEFQQRIQDLNKAIVGKLLVELDYLNLKGERVKRIIEPMTLMFKGYNWYLFAYCRLKEDGRLFKLSRVKEIALTNKTFLRKDISFKAYLKNEFSTGPPVDLVLRFSNEARQRVEEYFSPNQIENDNDSHLVVRVTYPEDFWVYSFILSYGHYVEVLEPHHIRDQIKDISGKIYQQYET